MGRTTFPANPSGGPAALVLLLLGSILLASYAHAQQAFYEPQPASWLGGEPGWDDTPADYTSYFPLTYVIFGFAGIPEVRSIVDEGTNCPMAVSKSLYDDNNATMEFGTVHGATYGIRATGDLVNSGQLPYYFPVQVCSIAADPESPFRDALDAGEVAISYQNMTYDQVPRVKRNPKRFLLTGDTGLRSKPDNMGLGKLGKKPCDAPEVYGISQCYLNFTQENLTQAPVGSFQGTDEWYFGQLADDASKRDIDLIVYVGDYLYRQGPCPSNVTDTSMTGEVKNCSGINLPAASDGDIPEDLIMNFLPGNFGDNWRGWWADFFWPAMNLLKKSPLIPTRGNHEICSRGGYGYFFFLAPQPLCSSCYDDLETFCGQATQPYPVSFQHEQFLVIDDGLISPYEGGIDHFMFIDGACPEAPEDGQRIVATQETRDDNKVSEDIAFYTNIMLQIEQTSKVYDTNFYVGHRPLFGMACNDTHMAVLDWTLQQSLGKHTLDRISAMIAGHMHWFEVLKFHNDSLPPQLVVGNGGTQAIPNYVNQDIWPHMRVEAGMEGLGIEGDVEWGLSKSEYGYSIMERNDDTLDYEVSFYFLSTETGQVELLPDVTLSIPKGPRVKSAYNDGTGSAGSGGSLQEGTSGGAGGSGDSSTSGPGVGSDSESTSDTGAANGGGSGTENTTGSTTTDVGTTSPSAPTSRCISHRCSALTNAILFALLIFRWCL